MEEEPSRHLVPVGFADRDRRFGRTCSEAESRSGERLSHRAHEDSGAVGQGGIILRTIDGGTSWTSDPSPTTNTLFCVAFENTDRGWIVGAYGTILAYAGDLGTTAESTPAQPMGISLGPNYPNPFNPRTTIHFTLQEPGQVTVQVIDVLGRMIETLVDEFRTAGEHAVTWTAVDAPSDVYFYRLSTATGHVGSTMTLIR